MTWSLIGYLPMKAERVVLDTSILISAALSASGKPAAVLDHVLANATLILSAEIFHELTRKVLEPKFDKYLRGNDRADLLTKLAATAEWTEIDERVTVCRDPNDDMIIETALAGRADCIVTGDKDLLVLDPFRTIRIVSAATFLLSHVA
jgi:uncharacterized protein